MKNKGIITSVKETVNNGKIEKTIRIRLDNSVKDEDENVEYNILIDFSSKSAQLIPTKTDIKNVHNFFIALNKKCSFKLSPLEEGSSNLVLESIEYYE